MYVRNTCPIGAAKLVDGILEIAHVIDAEDALVNVIRYSDGEQGYKIFIGEWEKKKQCLNKTFKT